MRFQLPGGRVALLRPKGESAPKRRKDEGKVLFDGALALFKTDVDIVIEGEARVEPEALDLAEFHALRAIATHLGWLDEEEVEIECRNCGEVMSVRPCASLPLGPFADSELDDPELDELTDLGREHDVPDLGLVRLAQVTVGEAFPLHRALTKRRLRLTPAVVKAMGIVSIGDERDPARIAELLTRSSDRAFGNVTNLFLAAHYPLRLFAPVICAKCGSRNDVDAPYDRELSPYEEPVSTEPFISFDGFDAMTQRIAAPLLAETPSSASVALVVDGEVPACDDGGDPLLGSYVPASDGRNAEITLYYRSFADMWKDGPYDLEDELTDTIEHELEHHESSLVGYDAKDDEERDEIVRETRRVMGKKAVARASVTAFGADVGEFWRRTWLVWFVALIAVIVAVLASR